MLRILMSSASLLACVLVAACLPHPSNRSPVKPTEFSALYAENCAGCHGTDGRNGPARILHDAVLVAYMPADQIKLVIQNGRPGTSMPAFGRDQGGPLDDGQVDAIVRGIQGWGRPIENVPTYIATATGDPHAGAKLFAQNCYMCHAKGAAVGPVTDPAYLTLVSNQTIRSSIVTGRPDLGMPDWRHLHMGKALTDQEITDLSAYLISLRPPGANPALQTDNSVFRTTSVSNQASGTSSVDGGAAHGDRSATGTSGTKP